MESSSSLVFVAFVAGFSTVACADVRMPAVFSDHMVLQRDVEAPVWGWADPGEQVTVSVISAAKPHSESNAKAGMKNAGALRTSAQTHSVTTDGSGKWSVKLGRLRGGDSLVLTVQGKNLIAINDVIVGEVWLGSGQSNMAMNVERAKDFEQERAAANLPQVRLFKEESGPASSSQAQGKGKWVICSPETVGEFSATLYFFGREIHRTLQVPVGLINSSVGGSPIELWIAQATQSASRELIPFFRTMEKHKAGMAREGEFSEEEEFGSHNGDSKKSRGARREAPQTSTVGPSAIRDANVGALFNGKIAPLIPYAIRGALWYQGEANTTPLKAPYYGHQLRLLVSDWRARWGYELPFAWVQLPGFGGPGRDWPTVRQGMLESLALRGTGMIITIDLGDERDIHPKNKQEVGRRIALWALGTVYGRDVTTTSGPLPISHEVRGNEMTVRFGHADGGLVARGGELRGFMIAAQDRQWKPAVARIQGSEVVVWSNDVKRPVAVRYAWSNFPTVTLYNGAGLPATPFRTDDWK